MMSQRKPLAALAAVTAALAIAVPATSASAAPTAPARTALIGAGGRLVPGSLPCQILIGELRFAAATHRMAWATFLSNAFVYSGCGGAAI
jgi:hypothetical protein